jgi:hypothetical protein
MNEGGLKTSDLTTVYMALRTVRSEEMDRKELMRMMPTDGEDILAATRIVDLGYPAIAPVLRDMMKWMRVAESPVADSLATLRKARRAWHRRDRRTYANSRTHCR